MVSDVVLVHEFQVLHIFAAALLLLLLSFFELQEMEFSVLDFAMQTAEMFDVTGEAEGVLQAAAELRFRSQTVVAFQ